MMGRKRYLGNIEIGLSSQLFSVILSDKRMMIEIGGLEEKERVNMKIDLILERVRKALIRGWIILPFVFFGRFD